MFFDVFIFSFCCLVVLFIFCHCYLFYCFYLLCVCVCAVVVRARVCGCGGVGGILFAENLAIFCLSPDPCTYQSARSCPCPPRPLPAMFNVYLCYSCRLCVNVLPVLLPPGWDYHSSQNLSFYMCTFSERIFSYLLVNIAKYAFLLSLSAGLLCKVTSARAALLPLPRPWRFRTLPAFVLAVPWKKNIISYTSTTPTTAVCFVLIFDLIFVFVVWVCACSFCLFIFYDL